MKVGLRDIIGHAQWYESCPPYYFAANLADYLNDGGDPNGTYDEKSCLPHWVARFGTAKQLDALISAGGDVNCRSPWDYTPLIWLYDVYSLYIMDENFVTRVIALLERGADINAANKDKETALHKLTMSQCPRPDEIEFVVGRGARIALGDKNGRRPIHNAGKMCQPQTARKLVELGADINVSDNQGQTPLHVIGENIGIWHWSEDMLACTVTALITMGADPNIQDKTGGTVLMEHVSSFGYFPKVIQALLDGGANPLIPNNDSLLPRHVALTHHNRGIATLLTA